MNVLVSLENAGCADCPHRDGFRCKLFGAEIMPDELLNEEFRASVCVESSSEVNRLFGESMIADRLSRFVGHALNKSYVEVLATLEATEVKRTSADLADAKVGDSK